MARGLPGGTLLIRVTLAVCLACFILPGHSADAQAHPKEDSQLTSASVVAAAFPMATSLLSTVPAFAPQTAATIPWISNPLLLGSHIPFYWVEPSRAAGYTVAGLLLPAAGIGLMFAPPSVPVAQPLSSTLLSGYSRLMQYAAYDTYRLAAPRAAGCGLAKLAAAPFRWDSVKSPLVWIPSIVAPAALVGYYLAFEPNLGPPVYQTGRSYIGTLQVNPVLGGISAAAFGAVDMLFFPALHLPGDLSAGLKPGTMLFNFGWRSAVTLALDEAMDRGGLPLAVAVHFWGDFVLIMARWVFYGG